MKSFTDIEQSKKLAEILPIDSADMYYHNRVDIPDNFPLPIEWKHSNKLLSQEIPCWSLAALIKLLPSELFLSRHYFLEISKMGDNSTPYEIRYYRFRESSDGADFGRITHISYSSQNLVDACYEMILKLHEQKLL